MGYAENPNWGQKFFGFAVVPKHEGCKNPEVVRIYLVRCRDRLARSAGKLPRMARRKNDQGGGTAGDRAELASGRASAADKREVGFVKRGGRLRPGKTTPPWARKAFSTLVRNGGKGGPTKRRKVSRRSGR